MNKLYFLIAFLSLMLVVFGLFKGVYLIFIIGFVLSWLCLVYSSYYIMNRALKMKGNNNDSDIT